MGTTVNHDRGETGGALHDLDGIAPRALAPEPGVRIEGSRVVLHVGLDLPEVAHYLEQRDDRERAAATATLLEIGVAVMERVVVARDVDFVRRRFDAFASDLDRQMHRLDGWVRDSVERTFAVDGRPSAAAALLDRFRDLHSGVQDLVTQTRRELDGRHSNLERFVADFEHRVASRFNPADRSSYLGQMVTQLETLLDPERGVLPRMLDDRLSFDRESSPFRRFVTDVLRELGELRTSTEAYRTALLGTQKLEEERAAGTRKGLAFEDDVEQELGYLASACGFELERVSVKAESGRSKKGDFALTYGNGAFRVVVETKDEHMTSLPAYKRILDEAMAARGAQYAVLVAREAAQLQPQVGGWQEYEGNKVITSRDALRIALRWAQVRAGLARRDANEVDPAALRTATEKARAMMARMVEIKKQATAIEGARSVIVKLADSICEGVNSALDEMLAVVKRSEQASPAASIPQ
jgi:hypothetical protein